MQLHGAEVDLIAKSRADIFAPPVYIEATVEYVDNTKYGKDLTKFVLIREREPDAKLLCISATGFTINVKERASGSRIETLTFDELFNKFQRFSKYLRGIASDSELIQLDRLYQDALFDDQAGKESASAFLSSWRKSSSNSNPWIVVIGDYGSGKTTLTKVLLKRWAEECLNDPDLAIPFRIELREFTRQFDARTLLHRFLDDNDLSYLNVDFIFHLIRQGRIVLFLDGYDEMAQFMHARERRACLAALAELAKDGAKGVLTSRPNYFTVTEELNLLETLYASIASDARFAKFSETVIEREKTLDALLQTQFLDRYERTLRDLDEDQTRRLVKVALENDPLGQIAVLEVLEMAFRLNDEGTSVSLSGKPVIVSYLLEVVDELKKDRQADNNTAQRRLTEWDVYQLIVDKLMWRDHNRAPELSPVKRRECLRLLAVELSSRQKAMIEEGEFLELTRRVFQVELRRVMPENREHELQRLFSDVRSSATLTRSVRGTVAGWRFSHNSLREYLASEYLVQILLSKPAKVAKVKVTDAMQKFARALSVQDLANLLNGLSEMRVSGMSGEVIGQCLAFVWDGGIREALERNESDPVGCLLHRVGGIPCTLRGLQLSRCSFVLGSSTATIKNADFQDATFTDVNFSGANLEQTSFAGAVLEGVSFRDARLRQASFRGAMLIEVDFSNADIEGAIFNGLEGCIGIIVDGERWDGEEALGYFAFNGAKTDPVKPISRCRHHPAWSIAEKISRKLCEGHVRQILGLVQKGTAAKDPREAERFLEYVTRKGLVEVVRGRNDLVRVTEDGRPALKAFYEGSRLDPKLYDFFGLAG